MTEERDDYVAYFARTNWRDDRRLVGMRLGDRRSHALVLGRTGTGKTTLLETIIRQDLDQGLGLALLDPHGDLVAKLAAAVPAHRQGDLIHFDVPETARPLGFNPLSAVAPGKRSVAVSGLIDGFRNVWSEFWGPRLEHVLRNALLALVELPEATLADALRLFDDKDYRKNVAGRVANAQVRRFWLKEFEGYPVRLRAEAVSPIQNKLGAYMADPILHRILTVRSSDFDLRRVMDHGKILLVSLSKGRIGQDAASLLGSLLVSQIGVAALSRADTSEDERRDFALFLDEFHNFSGSGLASMLAELRKYRCGLVLAAQHMAQVDPGVRDSLLGNVGSLICFRLGATDAEELEKEFRPELRAGDLVNLPNRQVYVRLMTGGVVSRPFSAETLGDKGVPGRGARTVAFLDSSERLGV